MRGRMSAARDVFGEWQGRQCGCSCVREGDNERRRGPWGRIESAQCRPWEAL